MCLPRYTDKIYATIEHLERENATKIDLLIICGDFQSVRNEHDLLSMAVPDKYRQMCSFWKYYAGVAVAPVLTLFIGGNHEASNYLSELPYGGWVAPNIYYMGYANVVQFGGVRIAGLSGIYNPQDYYKGHHEMPPYNMNTLKSAYHVRQVDVFRLSQLTRDHVDIVLTHDWPLGVYNHGNSEQLMRFKPFLANEIRANTLGSPENERLLKLLKPTYWFSAHLHAKFACVYRHQASASATATASAPKETKFLALDKCLPHRRFLQVIDVEARNGSKLCLSLDPEWLCVLKKTDHLMSVDSYPQAPISRAENVTVDEADLAKIGDYFCESLEIPNGLFKQTAPAWNGSSSNNNNGSGDEAQRVEEIYMNEQTTMFCEMLNLRDPIRVLLEKRGKSFIVAESTTKLFNQILDDDDDDDDDGDDSTTTPSDDK